LKTEKVPPGAIVCGLAILFVGVSIAVREWAPKPKTAQVMEMQSILQKRAFYFMEAELMAKQLYSDPSTHWSHAFTDENTGAILLGNDVWYAKGLIDRKTNGSDQRGTWEVCFLPESRTPLFVRVGSLKIGDGEAAMRRAGQGNSDPIKNKP
jgi:hypothetical protein